MIQMLIEPLTPLGISEQTLEYDANQEVRLAREQHMEKTAVDLPRATDGACHAAELKAFAARRKKEIDEKQMMRNL